MLSILIVHAFAYCKICTQIPVCSCNSLSKTVNSQVICFCYQEIIDAYLHRIQTLTFAGPTFLAPVLRRILRDHVPVSNQSSQCYVTVLILLDGIVNDLDELLPEVRKAKELPLSIVIAGVGPGNFHSMVPQNMLSIFCTKTLRIVSID